MTADRDLRADPDMERHVSSWLTQSDLTTDETERGLDRVLNDFPLTPQTRRRSLGRWLERVGGARRRTDEHEHPPDRTNRRHRLMSIATASVAALAVLALAVSITGPTDEIQPPAAEDGTTHVVAADGSGDFSTIGEAVAAAADGDTILIRPGTYTEAIVIDKDITLMGDGPREEVVVDIAGDGPLADFVTRRLRYAFWFRDADAELGNLTIHGPGRQVSAIVVVDGDPTVHDVVVDLDEYENWPHGFAYIRGDARGTFRNNIADTFVWIDDTASPLFEGNVIDNVIRNDGDSSARVVGNRLGGVWVRSRATPVIEDNDIDHEKDGSTFGSCGIELLARDTRPTVVGNVIRNAPVGVCLSNGDVVAFEDNEVIDSHIGIGLSSTDAEIRDNSISGGTAGMTVTSGGSPSLVGNRITGASSRGIAIGAHTSPMLSGNSICDNGTNLHVDEAAEPRIDDSNEICTDAPPA